jgi:inosine-uridine nucleoside N-ribohydrolase
MGSSLNPQTEDPEFAMSPRFEFNFWFDPEAARIVLRAHWPRIDVTTVDVSIKTMFTQEMFDAISRSSNPAAQYIAKFAGERYYLWDELAACAWLDPSIITKVRDVYMDVDLSHGPSLWTHTHVGREAQAVDRCPARARAGRPRRGEVHEDVRRSDVGNAGADANGAVNTGCRPKPAHTQSRW